MRAFAELYTALDESNKTNDKLAALGNYFATAAPEDAVWAVHFLIGRRPRRAVNVRKLAEWAAAEAQIADWLFSESYDAVGDLAETITLILPDSGAGSDKPLHYWIAERLLPLQKMDEPEQRLAILQAWRELDQPQRFIWNKLITGAFRVGVSQKLVIRALADVSHLEPALIAHRMMDNWEPTPAFFQELIAADQSSRDISQPYPFFLAYSLEDDPAIQLGPIAEWQAEWKWDGIRSQLIRRQGKVFLWSRGEELVTDRYPEIAEAAGRLPEGTVLDGELLSWKEGAVLPFAHLQRRIGRKTLTKKLLADVPVIFLAYDLLEYDGVDWRDRPLFVRREQLERIVATVSEPLLLSPIVRAETWEALAEQRSESRARLVEGLMLKRRDSPYRVGRQRGDWWKWKIEPFTVDAVLIYAQPGSGKRATLFTDYTFGVWDNAGQLIPFTKAYSGLTDAEIRQVDQFIRRNTLEKYGPVRTVKPELVFELAFEGIQRSSRHKSGIAVRFPRILRWRHDKPIQEADSLETIQAMLPSP
jgi:DNA ligase-1